VGTARREDRGGADVGALTTVVTMDDLGRGYPELLAALKQHGDLCESRAGTTKELLGFTLTLENPRRCVVDRESFSRDFMHLEIVMLLAGLYDRELTERVSPVAAGLITPLTAYGPRTKHQLREVLRELRRDPESRRAVVYVGRPDDLSKAGHPARAGEMPCTMTWQFLLRAGHLHMIVNMRSWDAVWGLAYDVPCFCSIQIALAAALGVRVGEYMHHAGSFHVYERHWVVYGVVNDEELELPWVAPEWDETVANAEIELESMRKRQLATT
jgi:thymidylate synthase